MHCFAHQDSLVHSEFWQPSMGNEELPNACQTCWTLLSAAPCKRKSLIIKAICQRGGSNISWFDCISAKDGKTFLYVEGPLSLSEFGQVAGLTQRRLLPENNGCIRPFLSISRFLTSKTVYEMIITSLLCAHVYWLGVAITTSRKALPHTLEWWICHFFDPIGCSQVAGIGHCLALSKMLE